MAPPLDQQALSPRELRRLGRSIPRRLSLTRQGKLLLTVTLMIGFGAVNSGNNLLYLVLGVLLSLIIISGVLSELTLKGVTAIRHEPPRLFSGTPTLVRIDLQNTKRWFTSLSIEVSELVGSATSLVQRRGFILSLPPGESAITHLRISATKRGVLSTAGLRIATRFPFGFFEKSRYVPLAGQYTIYPALHSATIPALPPTIAGNEEEMRRSGAGDEFYALRDAHDLDDARNIAWKATARRDKLIVKENQRPAARRLIIAVANVLPPLQGDARAEAEETLEFALSRAASLATLCSAQGYAVGIATSEGGVPPDMGPNSLTSIYEHLARLPLRTVQIGSQVPFHRDYQRNNTLRIAITTPEQHAAGLTPEADQLVLVDRDALDLEGGEPAVAPPATQGSRP
jgi:uncharacterized protein (DUF58 family)